MSEHAFIAMITGFSCAVASSSLAVSIYLALKTIRLIDSIRYHITEEHAKTRAAVRGTP